MSSSNECPKDTRKHHEVENVPPPPSMDMIIASPEFSKLAIKAQSMASPGSPTKRRQGSSHYDDLESSPSKRRIHHGEGFSEEFEGRGLLFTDSKNQRSQPDVFDDDVEEADVTMLSPTRPRAKSWVVQSRTKIRPELKRSQSRTLRQPKFLKVEVVLP